MTVVSEGVNTKPKLIKWYKENFENVNSDKTIIGYIQVPKSMGLTKISDGKIFLTNEGQDVLESNDLERIYDVMATNVFAIEEIYEYMKTSKDIQTEQSILKFLKDNFDVNWSTFAQVTFRLLWLVNLNKIKRTDDGYVLA